jgi:hypothetical protein
MSSVYVVVDDGEVSPNAYATQLDHLIAETPMIRTNIYRIYTQPKTRVESHSCNVRSGFTDST